MVVLSCQSSRNFRVVNYDRVIEWPEPGQGPDWPQVDIDADGLWHMARAQRGAVAAA